MVGRRRRMSVLAGGEPALCAATISVTAGATAAAAAPGGRTPLAGSMVTAAARQHPAGTVAKSAPVNFEVVLRLHGAAAAQALVTAVSTPGSASYRHYLTAAQWEARFSPAAAEVNSARKLAGQRGVQSGRHVQGPDHHLGLGDCGPGGEGVRHHPGELQGERPRSAPGHTPDVRPGRRGGQRGRRPGHQPERGHHRRGRQPRRQHEGGVRGQRHLPPAPPAFIPAPPCGKYFGQTFTTTRPRFGHGYPRTVPDQVCGYKPPQFRSAYNIGSNNTGQGVTVAIIDAFGSATIRVTRPGTSR